MARSIPDSLNWPIRGLDSVRANQWEGRKVTIMATNNKNNDSGIIYQAWLQ